MRLLLKSATYTLPTRSRCYADGMVQLGTGGRRSVSAIARFAILARNGVDDRYNRDRTGYGWRGLRVYLPARRPPEAAWLCGFSTIDVYRRQEMQYCGSCTWKASWIECTANDYAQISTANCSRYGAEKAAAFESQSEPDILQRNPQPLYHEFPRKQDIKTG